MELKEIKLLVNVRCVSCVGNIKKVLKKITEEVEVNTTLKFCKIKYNKATTSKESIIKAIQNIGYEVEES